MTIDELKAALEGEALETLDGVLQERDEAVAARAEAEEALAGARARAGSGEAVDDPDLADVLGRVSDLQAKVEAVGAENEALRARAAEAEKARYEERAKRLGIPAALKPDADALYASGGIEAVEAAAKRWGEAGMLVASARQRLSREPGPGDEGAQDPKAAAQAKLDAFGAEHGEIANYTLFRRAFKGHDREAHDILFPHAAS